jgi:hypothetical protein
MTKDKALKLALEALTALLDEWTPARQAQLKGMEAVTAIKQALATPVQDVPETNFGDIAAPVQPVAWAGHNLDDMCEAFDRVIEEHASRKNPFHDPVNKDAMIALRILRGFVPYMKRYTTPPAQPAPVQDEDLYDLAVKADNGGQP